MAVSSNKVSTSLLAALAVLALAAGGCPVTQPQDTPVPEMLLREPGSNTKYYLYVPSNYDPARAWPMMVTLHGSYLWDGPQRQVKEWKHLAEQRGFVVVAPFLKSTQGTLPAFTHLRKNDLAEDEQNVLAIMEDIRKRYCIDEKSVMISGYSAGGFPLHYIALRNPQLFSVAVSRTANCDMKIVRDIPITDAARKLHYLIFFSKRGINPAASNLNPVARQSWAIFRHLRQQHCSTPRSRRSTAATAACPARPLSFGWPITPTSSPSR